MGEMYAMLMTSYWYKNVLNYIELRISSKLLMNQDRSVFSNFSRPLSCDPSATPKYSEIVPRTTSECEVCIKHQF